MQAKTNNKGEWSINNIAGGMWEIEFGKEGFAPQRITLDLKRDQRIPNIDVILETTAGGSQRRDPGRGEAGR